MATQASSGTQTIPKYPPMVINLNHAHEIPSMCTKLAKILNENPLFDGQGSEDCKSKLIALAEWNDVRICDIFNTNKKIHGNPRAWHIYQFSRFSQRRDADGCSIEQGLTLRLYDKVEMCSYAVLENAYNEVFFKMITGWEKANIKDHPDIMCKEDPRQFELFIKESSLKQEVILLRYIALRLSLEGDIKCANVWIKDAEYCFEKKIYLWIRKTAIETVREKVGFKL